MLLLSVQGMINSRMTCLGRGQTTMEAGYAQLRPREHACKTRVQAHSRNLSYGFLFGGLPSNLPVIVCATLRVGMRNVLEKHMTSLRSRPQSMQIRVSCSLPANSSHAILIELGQANRPCSAVCGFGHNHHPGRPVKMHNMALLSKTARLAESHGVHPPKFPKRSVVCMHSW